MLGGVKLTVDLTLQQTCFAYINPKYCSNAQESQCIQVQVGDSHVYLWAVFMGSVQHGTILLHPLHCRLLEMTVGQDVYVYTSSNIRPIECLFIEADGNEDQVILEHNQIQLQRVFLNQVRLVVANQKAVVWLSPSVPIVFTPQQTGILVNQSSIIVRLNVLENRGLAPLPSPRQEEKQKNSCNAIKGLLRPLFRLPKRMALRALPIEGDGKKDLLHPYTVFMHEDLIEDKYKTSIFIVALMKSLPSMIPNKNEVEDDDNFWRYELCVEVVPVDSVVFRSLCREVYSEYIPTVIIPRSLNKIINVENGTMTMLTFIDNKTLRQPYHIEIITYTSPHLQGSDLYVIDRFKEIVVQNTYSGKVFLINHDIVKENRRLCSGYIKFKLTPEGLLYTTLTQETFRQCTISARRLDPKEMTVRYPVVSMDYDYKCYCRTIKPLEFLLEKVISHIHFDIHREARYNKCSDLKSSVLVTGLSGTGKSSLCNLVEKEISVYSYILHCRPLKGRKDIPGVLAKALLMCTDRKPALLIMDDIDAMVPANMEGLSPQDITNYNGLAVEIKQILSMSTGVSLLLTARSVADLHPVFRMFTGQPLFTAQFNMPELAQEDRVQLFQHLMTHKIRDQFEVDVDDVIRLAMDCNGGTIRDITDYFNRKLFAAIKKRNPNGPKQRIVEDVTKDVEKAKAYDIWGPLGGMHYVKEKLNECIFWPIMYPALFPSQGCGILLYGPPGTGKSLIGSCLAKMTNMNMIQVKGPELLSKYIGQSEAAVREVFDQADMKRPCILFFDEFDSLAPRRGHDSTGVTDRVVNQLLARLDGAEGGARGPVLAATSRPDLLDPALLRAGRLSTHVCCDLPGLEGRYDVLCTLAKDFHLRQSVDLKLVAEATDGYSPADLKSLLVTAQLSRLELELFQIRLTDDTDHPTLESVVISTEDIDNALAETKPSLSKQQRRFYDSIYRRFRGEVPPYEDLTHKTTQQIPPNDDMELRPRMRVTLA